LPVERADNPRGQRPIVAERHDAPLPEHVTIVAVEQVEVEHDAERR
jgi:hypothetical protein